MLVEGTFGPASPRRLCKKHLPPTAVASETPKSWVHFCPPCDRLFSFCPCRRAWEGRKPDKVGHGLGFVHVWAWPAWPAAPSGHQTRNSARHVLEPSASVLRLLWRRRASVSSFSDVHSLFSLTHTQPALRVGQFSHHGWVNHAPTCKLTTPFQRMFRRVLKSYI